MRGRRRFARRDVSLHCMLRNNIQQAPEISLTMWIRSYRKQNCSLVQEKSNKASGGNKGEVRRAIRNNQMGLSGARIIPAIFRERDSIHPSIRSGAFHLYSSAILCTGMNKRCRCRK